MSPSSAKDDDHGPGEKMRAAVAKGTFKVWQAEDDPDYMEHARKVDYHTRAYREFTWWRAEGWGRVNMNGQHHHALPRADHPVVNTLTDYSVRYAFSDTDMSSSIRLLRTSTLVPSPSILFLNWESLVSLLPPDTPLRL